MQRRQVCLLLTFTASISLFTGCSSRLPTADSETNAVPPDAVPQVEPKSKMGNMSSYVVFGHKYYTRPTSRDYVERGVASWYGSDFHGRKTSNGERYDMYDMTAAHKTLPLPTYARVTNLENGRSTVLRINDRGPFHDNRLIDLSYSAARKLGVVQRGTAKVEVRSIDPRDHGGKLIDAPVPRQRDVLASDAPTMAAQTPAPRPVSSERELFSDESFALTMARSASTSSQSSRAVTVAQVEKPVRRVQQVEKPASIAKRSTAPTVAQVEKPKPSRAATRTTAPVTSSGVYVQVAAFSQRGNAEQLKQRLTSAVAQPVHIRAGQKANAAVYRVQVGPLADPNQAQDVATQLQQSLAKLGLGKVMIVAK